MVARPRTRGPTPAPDAPAAAARAAARERRLLRAAQRGDEGARSRLVAANLGLVRAVASRYRDLGLPFDDLVQEGSLGLLDAIDRYDEGRGAPFESYARFRVRRWIRNALTQQGRVIRLPKAVVERRRALDRAEAAFVAASGGRSPSAGELAAATGLPIAAIREARAVTGPPVSLDEPILPDGTSLESVVADAAAPDPERRLMEHERSDLLHEALDRLPPRQRVIVSRRWGLDGRDAPTAEVAAALGLSNRRTQTLASDGLYRLRAALEQDGAAEAVSRPGSRRSRSRARATTPA